MRHPTAQDRRAKAPRSKNVPASLVGSVEMVGLRAESVEALARSWESRADELRIRASGHRNHGRGFAALKNDERADTLYDCVNELRRHAGLPTVRQPEPNNSGQTAGENNQPKA